VELFFFCFICVSAKDEELYDGKETAASALLFLRRSLATKRRYFAPLFSIFVEHFFFCDSSSKEEALREDREEEALLLYLRREIRSSSSFALSKEEELYGG
jgi:hypothetical protein